MKVRAATTADVQRVYGLECEIFPRPWSLIELRAACDGEHGGRVRILGSADNEHVFAYSIWRAIPPELELLRVATALEHRRLGYAQRLLERTLAEAVEQRFVLAWLEVAARNPSARGLYAQLGFVEAGRRRGYYPAAGAGERPDDAIVLRREL